MIWIQFLSGSVNASPPPPQIYHFSSFEGPRQPKAVGTDGWAPGLQRTLSPLMWANGNTRTSPSLPDDTELVEMSTVEHCCPRTAVDSGEVSASQAACSCRHSEDSLEPGSSRAQTVLKATCCGLVLHAIPLVSCQSSVKCSNWSLVDGKSTKIVLEGNISKFPLGGKTAWKGKKKNQNNY